MFNDGRLIRVLVWVAIIIIALLSIPGTLGLVWAPSCASCHHSDSFTRQSAARAHATTPCLDCHGGQTTIGKIAFREVVMYQMVLHLRPIDSVQVAQVSNRACETCHSDTMAGESKPTLSNGIRIVHETCAAQVSCVSCHSTVAHGTGKIWPETYSMDACLSCHSNSTSSASTKTNCSQCHEGTYTKITDTTPSTFQIVHGPNWRTTHGLGDMTTCSDCHATDFCEPCHGARVPHDHFFLRQHGQEAKQKDSQCATCHTDTSFCDNCHGMDMPHPSGFLKDHAATVDADSDAVCANCHLKIDCDNCHAAHVHPGGVTSLVP